LGGLKGEKFQKANGTVNFLLANKECEIANQKRNNSNLDEKTRIATLSEVMEEGDQ
jgi:hypothetical protein